MKTNNWRRRLSFLQSKNENKSLKTLAVHKAGIIQNRMYFREGREPGELLVHFIKKMGGGNQNWCEEVIKFKFKPDHH